MYIVIDRFEGEYAVLELEDGTFVTVPGAFSCPLTQRKGMCSASAGMRRKHKKKIRSRGTAEKTI